MSTVAPSRASCSATARPSPSVDPVIRTTVSVTSRTPLFELLSREAVELGEDVLAAGVPVEGELDLAAHDAHVRLVACADRLGARPLPDLTHHFGAGYLTAGVGHERAITHLRQGGFEVLDVRRLVGADVRHQA